MPVPFSHVKVLFVTNYESVSSVTPNTRLTSCVRPIERGRPLCCTLNGLGITRDGVRPYLGTVMSEA